MAQWDVERRVCVAKHFDTYLRSMLSDETLSADEISELVRRAGDMEFVKEAFRDAARRCRRNGKSFVPVYFDELTSHVDGIARQDIASFLKALFEIQEEIDLAEDADKGFMAMADTRLRLHWLMRRLTEDLIIDERTAIYLGALEHAPLSWLIDFARSARGDYEPEGNSGPTPPEKCLVTKEAVGHIVNLALLGIRSAAAEGRLLAQRNPLGALYSWRLFAANDPAEVRVCTDKLLTDDQSALTLMRALTSTSYSVGMGFSSMGDRVATPHMNVFVPDDMDILDLASLRNALERIKAGRAVDADSLEAVKAFLEAWDKKLADGMH